MKRTRKIHVLNGNCLVDGANCMQCLTEGRQAICDVCHEHEQPRGNCVECERCEPCHI